MNSTSENNVIIACCGLVCSECGAFVKGKCKGCHSNKPMFASCPVKKCVKEHSYATCADCRDFSELRDCKKLNNFISKIFGFIFRSDRIGKLERIRAIGLEPFKAEQKRMT